MNDTIPFIDIPEWDFHWQGLYSFPRVLKVPMNTRLYSSALYDNTTANHHNPNNPPQLITLGESTTDEMMLIYFAFTPYIPGDENIIIDSAIVSGIEPIHSSVISTPQLYEPMPNPVVNTFTFQYYLPKPAAISLSILDLEGKLIREEKNKFEVGGIVTMQWDISELPSGIYFLSMKADGIIRTKKFVKE